MVVGELSRLSLYMHCRLYGGPQLGNGTSKATLMIDQTIECAFSAFSARLCTAVKLLIFMTDDR